MLELDVLPEHGLYSDQIEFILGMHFSHAVASIQALVGCVKGVQILYSDVDALNVDLVVNLTQDGIHLVFDPVTQRLKVIEVYDLALLRLKYGDILFNCPEVAPTIEQIDQTFGATHPGVYDDEKQAFTLTFRGLAFEFPADTKFQPTYAGIRQKLGQLQFPPGESPHVSKMSIYCGNSLSECSAPSLPLPRYPTLYQDGLEIIRRQRQTLGIRIRLVSVPNLDEGDRSPTGSAGGGGGGGGGGRGAVSSSVENVGGERACLDYPTPREIYFGDSVQDVIAADVLFDAKRNAVKKFVLHTNYPGHYNFNMYHRCQFELPLYQENSSSGTQQYISTTPITVTAFSKWEEISDKMKPSERPVVLNRASSTNTTNPFGSTFCYGYQDIIFEVMPNGHLASLTLYALDGGRRGRRSLGEFQGLEA
ncbi:hypothetical protein TCAL_11074 [Tigriopus californicus]|uniref:Uncharacterized protein n=1 Tax=Tigriopus californicus TaxID=6832 RepID=A0A553N6R8_TIGCA|nr:hypothetical protein TCAL_11074 [Tigriopus californicus]